MDSKTATIIGLILISLVFLLSAGCLDQETYEHEPVSDRSSEKSTFQGIPTYETNTAHCSTAFYLPTLSGMLEFHHFSDSSGDTRSFSVSRSIMDTIVTIAVLDTNETHALESIDRAFDEIYYVDALMSSYKNDSQLSILNTRGHLDGADPDFVYVLERSKYYSGISDGAFDVTIKPILDLWSSKYSPGGTYMPPTQKEINETLELVDYSGITIGEDSISLRPNMSIVLGGIAKGYSADRAIESLKLNGITNGFVNAGGDGRFIGHSEAGTPWYIGLQNPDKSTNVVTCMAISDMAVATSGNYERYFSDAAKVSHISDPRTGYSSRELISATVIANTAMDADALATAVFVLGESGGISMIEELEGIECLIITDDKRILCSSGFGEYEI